MSESEAKVALTARAHTQFEHLAWHGDDLHHWHVGVTALDVDGSRTEEVSQFYGAPVYRLLDMPRDALRAVPRSISSCHWPEGTP